MILMSTFWLFLHPNLDFYVIHVKNLCFKGQKYSTFNKLTIPSIIHSFHWRTGPECSRPVLHDPQKWKTARNPNPNRKTKTKIKTKTKECGRGVISTRLRYPKSCATTIKYRTKATAISNPQRALQPPPPPPPTPFSSPEAARISSIRSSTTQCRPSSAPSSTICRRGTAAIRMVEEGAVRWTSC